MHIMCFDQVHLRLFPSNSFSVPNSFSSQFHVFFLQTHGVRASCVCMGRLICWKMASLLGTASLKKTDSPSSSSHQSPIASQIGVGLHKPLLHPCWNFVWIDLVAGPVHSVTVVSSCVQWPYHVCLIFFCCKCPLPQTLTIFLFLLLQWVLNPRGGVHKKFVSPDMISDAWGLDDKMQKLTINHTATLFSEDRGGPGVEECYSKCKIVMLQSTPNTAQVTVTSAGLLVSQKPRNILLWLLWVIQLADFQGSEFLTWGRGQFTPEGWVATYPTPHLFWCLCLGSVWRILLWNHPFLGSFEKKPPLMLCGSWFLPRAPIFLSSWCSGSNSPQSLHHTAVCLSVCIA